MLHDQIYFECLVLTTTVVVVVVVVVVVLMVELLLFDWQLGLMRHTGEDTTIHQLEKVR